VLTPAVCFCQSMAPRSRETLSPSPRLESASIPGLRTGAALAPHGLALS
jgi:hypothetical protein